MFAALNSFLTGALAKVTDVYWPFVSMLLHGDSPQQFNQDTSTNVFPISDSAVAVYGVASMQASTRTPFTGGPSSNGSGFFNGTNAGLSIPTNAAFTLGSTQTTEMWVYATASTYQTLITFYSATGLDVILSGGKVVINGANANTTASFPLNAWTHLAVVFNAGTLTIYFNGVSQALAGVTTGYNYTASSTVYIGNQNGNGGFFSQGYISNLRVVKGVAVYTGNFTPPTASLAATQSSGTNISAITGTQTSLLTLQTNVPQNNNQFFDTSTNNFTVTRNGNTTQGSFNPFVSTYPYAVATNGGSGYFDGTGDYLTVPDSTAFTLGTNDFTIECWVNFSSLASNPTIAGQSNAAASQISFYLTVGTTGGATFIIRNAAGTTYATNSSVGAIVINTWYHVAFVRDGNTARQYINGVQTGTVNVTGVTVYDSADVLGIGSLGAYIASQLTNGYISNFRLVNGTCLYPSGTTFTPPTAPLTAVTNTALLLGMSNAAIFDNTMLNNLETVGDAQISTSVFKYGTGSLKFDGTGDYLTTPNKALFSFGTGDFTIEMWVYPQSFAGYNTLIEARSGGTASSYGLFIDITTGKIYWYDASGVQLSSSGLTLNTWAHVAASRTSGVLKLFIAGVEVYSAANTNAQNPTGNFVIGRNIEASPIYFNGYIDDLRVTKGIARYTATFTPPIAAFPNQGPFAYPIGYPTQRAIFGYGYSNIAPTNVTNLVSNTGVVATDTSGVGSARYGLAAASYGGDKAIFGYGSQGFNVSMTNLVSNTGVVSTDVTGVGTARTNLAAAGYGGGKAIFGYGYTTADVSLTNLVSSTGVVATDTTGVGTARTNLAAAGYGLDKAIFGYGLISGVTRTAITNLVSNTGVVATDTTGVGTIRDYLAAASYGVGKAIFGYGYDNFGAGVISMTNLVSTTGVVATDTTGVGTARYLLAAAAYGGDKAIFGYGNAGAAVSMTNLVSNTGVVATDTTGVGTGRYLLAAAGYSV